MARGGHSLCCVGVDKAGLWTAAEYYSDSDKGGTHLHNKAVVVEAQGYMYMHWKTDVKYAQSLSFVQMERVKVEGGLVAKLGYLASAHLLQYIEAINIHYLHCLLKKGSHSITSRHIKGSFPFLNGI